MVAPDALDLFVDGHYVIVVDTPEDVCVSHIRADKYDGIPFQFSGTEEEYIRRTTNYGDRGHSADGAWKFRFYGWTFISVDRLRAICTEEAKRHGVNLKNADKAKSDQNKCIQLADFIAGASRARFEYGDTSIKVIRDKISIARRR